MQKTHDNAVYTEVNYTEVDTTYKGCWADCTGGRDLPTQAGDMTAEECKNAAAAAKKRYFAMQYHNGVSGGNVATDKSQCFYGDSYGSQGQSTNCYAVNTGYNVGGSCANAVYSWFKLRVLGYYYPITYQKITPIAPGEASLGNRLIADSKADCKVCPSGKYQEEVGLNECKNCPEGTVRQFDQNSDNITWNGDDSGMLHSAMVWKVANAMSTGTYVKISENTQCDATSARLGVQMHHWKLWNYEI